MDAKQPQRREPESRTPKAFGQTFSGVKWTQIYADRKIGIVAKRRKHKKRTRTEATKATNLGANDYSTGTRPVTFCDSFFCAFCAFSRLFPSVLGGSLRRYAHSPIPRFALSGRRDSNPRFAKWGSTHIHECPLTCLNKGFARN